MKPMAIILFALLSLWGYHCWRQKQQLEASSGKLKDLICEAHLVSQDMEEMLNKAVDISRTMIDDLEDHLQRCQGQLARTPPADCDPLAGFCEGVALGPDLDESLWAQAATMDEGPKIDGLDSQRPLAGDGPVGMQLIAEDDYNSYRQMHPTLAVNQLYQQGYSSREISQILQKGHDETLLILNLYKRKKVKKANSKA